MSHGVILKAREEVNLLLLVGLLSMTLSVLLIGDASAALVLIGLQMAHVPLEQYALPISFVRACELAFATVWLSLSSAIMRDARNLRKEHLKRSVRREFEASSDDERKSRLTKLVIDLVGTYRAHYRRLVAVLLSAVVVSSTVIITAVYAMLSGLMSAQEVIFSWALNASVLLLLSGVYIQIHRKWGRKLLRVEGSEEVFSDVLGGPFEA